MTSELGERTTQPTTSSSAFRSTAAPDRFMRRLLGVEAVDLRSGEGAHHAFRTSVLISGIRCLITYLAIPILIPVMSLAGWVAAPVGILLCIVAVVNGVASMQRFWRADHRHRWVYTVFMGVVFAILALALISDFSRLGALS